MAKKKTNYMSEKRFSLNDLIICCVVFLGVLFFAAFLSGVSLYADRGGSGEIARFSKEGKSITDEELFTFYEDKVAEEASHLEYNDDLLYAITDINSDGIVDLIIKYISNGNVEFQFYTYDEEDFNNSYDMLVYAGSVGGADGKFYKSTGDNFLLFVGNVKYYVYLENGVVSTFPVSGEVNVNESNLVEFFSYKELNILQ